MRKSSTNCDHGVNAMLLNICDVCQMQLGVSATKQNASMHASHPLCQLCLLSQLQRLLHNLPIFNEGHAASYLSTRYAQGVLVAALADNDIPFWLTRSGQQYVILQCYIC